MTYQPLAADSNQATRGLRVDIALDQNGKPSAMVGDETKFPGAELREVSAAELGRPDLTGYTLGPYALGAKLGMGGMGQVYVAEHRRLQKPFAIKFVASQVATVPEALERFEAEVKALGKLQHPHIVSAVDAGHLQGMPYLVTELVPGMDLTHCVQRHGALPVAEACELIRQAALGLQHSHQAGFLHRDIKPSNLILDKNGMVKLLDFGLVRSSSGETSLTEHGSMLGTWDYVPPEQAENAHAVDHRADLYSLGGTLLYLLSGQPPFGNESYSTVAAKLKGHLHDTPPWLKSAPTSIPKTLHSLLTRMLHKSPSARPQQAAEVAAALLPFASGADLSRLFNEPLPATQLALNSAHPSRNALIISMGSTALVFLMLVSGGFYLSGTHVRTQEQANEQIEPTTAPEPSPHVMAPTNAAPMNAVTKQQPDVGLPTPAESPPTVVTKAPTRIFSATAVRKQIPSGLVSPRITAASNLVNE